MMRFSIYYARRVKAHCLVPRDTNIDVKRPTRNFGYDGVGEAGSTVIN